MKNKVVNLKTAIMVIPCIACFLFCGSCSNDPPIEPLSDEEVSSNLVTMRGIFSNGSIDPELLIGEWKLTKFAYTTDGKKISDVVAILNIHIDDFMPSKLTSIWRFDESIRENSIGEMRDLPDLPDLSSGLFVTLAIGQRVFLYSISDNLISYHVDCASPFRTGYSFSDEGWDFSDEGWDVYKALQNTFSFVIIDNVLIIHFTEGENKNLIIFEKQNKR